MAKEDKERYAKELNFSTTFQIFRIGEKVRKRKTKKKSEKKK
jgi:hypothetical protein